MVLTALEAEQSEANVWLILVSGNLFLDSGWPLSQRFLKWTFLPPLVINPLRPPSELHPQDLTQLCLQSASSHKPSHRLLIQLGNMGGHGGHRHPVSNSLIPSKSQSQGLISRISGSPVLYAWHSGRALHLVPCTSEGDSAGLERL